MDFTAFLWGVFQGVLANRADDIVFGQKPGDAPEPSLQKSAERAQVTNEPRKVQRFRTFDAWRDIERFVSTVRSPVVHLLIEDQPSTYYNLPGYVLESRDTGEWFVFSRGRLALQGSGGGLNNMRDVVAILQSKGTNIVAWVIQSSALDALEDGQETWPSLKNDVIPLLSHYSEDPVWLGIRHQFETFVSGNES